MTAAFNKWRTVRMRLSNLTEKNPDTNSLSVCQEILCFFCNPKLHYHVETEVITAVVMTIFVFWNIAPCSSVNVSWCFRGSCRLHLQGRRVNQARNQHEIAYFMLVCLLLGLPSIENMEAKCSSESSVDFQRTIRRYIPEDRTLHGAGSFSVLDPFAQTVYNPVSN
jgi:hypothetical protein